MLLKTTSQQEHKALRNGVLAWGSFVYFKKKTLWMSLIFEFCFLPWRPVEHWSTTNAWLTELAAQRSMSGKGTAWTLWLSSAALIIWLHENSWLEIKSESSDEKSDQNFLLRSFFFKWWAHTGCATLLVSRCFLLSQRCIVSRLIHCLISSVCVSTNTDLPVYTFITKPSSYSLNCTSLLHEHFGEINN